MTLLSDRVDPQILFLQQRTDVRGIPEDAADLLPEVFQKIPIHIELTNGRNHKDVFLGTHQPGLRSS